MGPGNGSIEGEHEYFAETLLEPSHDRSDPAEAAATLLADWWQPLMRGVYALVGHFFSPLRCYAILQRRRRAQPLTPPQGELLRRLVLGDQQKSIALDLGISVTAVSLRAQRCVQRLGLTGRAAWLPLFVVAAGIAFHACPPKRLSARTLRRVVSGEEVEVCSFTRPDLLIPALCESESEVARLLVEGLSQSQIAERRGTSLRTAGNQIGALFGKLGVKGRVELIHSLLDAAGGRENPARADALD